MQTSCDIKVLPGQALVNKDGMEILSTIKLPRYMEYIDYIMGKIFTEEVAKRGWTIADLTNRDHFKQLYSGIRVFIARDVKARKLDDSVKMDLAKIVMNWDLVSSYHQEYDAVVTKSDDKYENEVPEEEQGDKENITTDEDEGNVDENDSNAEYDNTGNRETPLQLASSNIRTLLRLLSKSKVSTINGDEVMVEDEIQADGLPTSADFSSLFNNLAIRLAGRKNDEDFFGALQSKELIKVFPEVKQLNQILNLGRELTKKQVVQISEFYKIFSRPEIKLYLTKLFDDNGVKTINLFPQLRANRDKIKAQFRANFTSQVIPGELKQYVKIDGEYTEPRIASLPLTGTSNFTLDISDIDLSIDFKPELDLLQLIGINLTGINLITSAKEKEIFLENLIKVRTILHPNIQERINAGQLLYNPIDDLSKNFEGIRGNKNIIDTFINMESWFSSLAPTIMTTNSKGEPQSDISNDNAISVSLYHLNNSRTVKDIYNTPSYSKANFSHLFKQSKSVKFLFDKEGNRIPSNKIEVINYNGFQSETERSKVTRDLGEVEKITVDLNAMLQYGVKDILRTSTSNSFYALRNSVNGKSEVYYPYGSFKEGFKSNTSFSNDIINYLDTELKRINEYNKNPEKYSTTKQYGSWSIFSEMLTDDLKNDLVENGIEPNREKVLAQVDNYFEGSVNDLKNIFNSSKKDVQDTISSNLRKENTIDDLFRAFLANSFTTDIEFTAIVSGEPVFYKDMNKRLKALASTGNIAASISPINKFLSDNSTERAWKERYALSSKQRSNDEDYKSQVINEEVSTSNAYTSKELRQGIKDSIKKRDGRDISEEELDKVLDGTDDIKVSDGQGYVSLDFHRELAFRFGFWTPNLEKVYQYEGLYFKSTNQKLTEDEQAELDDLRDLIYSNPDSYAIPVLKVTYFGNILNTDVKVDAKAYDKFSLAPLVPSFIANHPKLDALSRQMVKTQTGYIKYQSGTKLFVRKSVEMGEVGVDADLQATQLLKEQLKTKIDQKTESALPTQFVKLVMSNLFDQGKAISKEAAKLYSDYFDLLKSVQKEQQIKVLDDLGFKYNYVDGKPQITSFNPDKIIDKVVREVNRQSLPSSTLKFLETTTVDGVTRFKYDPEASGGYQIISDLVTGVVDDTLRRYKLNSADFVLVSSANIKDKLKFFEYTDKGTIACECKVTLTKSFTPLLRKLDPVTNTPIGSIERLNKLLKNKEFVEENKKALTIVYSRPPVQGPNSMGFSTVQEFLPPTMGNVLMLPDEFVAKAGIDFDYDKEKVILPQLTPEGEFVSQERHDQIVKNIQQLEEDYPELRELAASFDFEDQNENVDNFISKIFKTTQPSSSYLDADQAVIDTDNEIYRAYESYFSLQKYNKFSTTNNFLELYTKILSLPELFADLVTPNATGLVKPLAAGNSKDLGRIEKGFVEENGSVKLPALGKAYEYMEQLRIFRTFFNSKELLGGFAVDNTFQQLYTQNNMQLNPTYKDGKNLRSINLMLFSPEQRESVMKDGKITIGKRFNQDEVLIQHLNSEFINATVDAEKDPYFSELNIAWENIGVFNMLKDLGLPADQVRDFINLPVMRKYFEYKKQFGNKTAALGKVLQDMEIGEPDEFTTTALYSIKDKGIKHNYSAVGKKLQENPDFPGTGKIWFPVEEVTKRILPYSHFKLYPYLRDINNSKVDYYISKERLRELKFLPHTSNREDNLNLLANFVEWEKHAQQLGSFRQLFNFDTRKVSSAFEIDSKAALRNKIITTGMISQDSLDRFESGSVISTFNNNDIIGQIFENIFTTTNTSVVKGTLSDLYNAYSTSFGRNKTLLRNLPKLLNNEFLRSVVDNFGQYNGKSIIDYSTPLLAKYNQDIQENYTLADRLANLRKLPVYNDIVRQYPILSRFTPDISTVPMVDGIYRLSVGDKIYMSKPHNIRFIRNSSEVISEVEGYIEQLRALISPDLNIPTLKEGQKEKLQNLVKDLLIAGYFQSGFSKSFQGYNDLIPPEFMLDIIPPALDRFNNLTEFEKERYMNGFYQLFPQNNKAYFPKVGQKNANRGKNYKIVLDKPVVEEVTPEKVAEKIVEQSTPQDLADITEITRENKKTKYTLKYENGTETEVEGYRVKVKEYPNFQAFLVKSSTNTWTMYEFTTSKIISRGNTIKELLPEVTEYFNLLKNNNGNLKLLQSIGLFIDPENNLPQVSPDKPMEPC